MVTGASLSVHSPETPGPRDLYRWSMCLDLNAPLGEPWRLYVNARRWSVILGLLPGHGCSRYRYHRDEEGEWARNEKPHPLHWGWLTIDRR